MVVLVWLLCVNILFFFVISGNKCFGWWKFLGLVFLFMSVLVVCVCLCVLIFVVVL